MSEIFPEEVFREHERRERQWLADSAALAVERTRRALRRANLDLDRRAVDFTFGVPRRAFTESELQAKYGEEHPLDAVRQILPQGFHVDDSRANRFEAPSLQPSEAHRLWMLMLSQTPPAPKSRYSQQWEANTLIPIRERR